MVVSSLNSGGVKFCARMGPVIFVPISYFLSFDGVLLFPYVDVN